MFGPLRLGLHVALAALALAATGFAQGGAPVPTLLSGSLLNASKAGVPNGQIQWSVPGAAMGPGNTAFSDSSGKFAFEIPVSSSLQVTLSIVTNLYNSAQTNVTLQSGVTSNVKISLTRKPSSDFGSVTGKVKNASGAVIPGATVAILGAGDFLATTSDSTGKYTFTHVGFNSNLTIRVSTAHSPCIVSTVIPLDVNATHVSSTITAQGVTTISPNCPAVAQSPAGGGALARPAIGTDDSVQWEQADVFSIASPGVPSGYNAGRINDILRFPPGQGLLVASDEGGVWNIAEDANHTATPLSNKWPSVAISSLAQGTGGPQDVYAGTFNNGDSLGGQLWESDTSMSQPLQSWGLVSPQPPCNNINKILVVSEAALIVLACDSGLYSSFIPPAPSLHGTYNWQEAVPAQIGGMNFSGLAKGPGWSVTGTLGTIAASRWAPSSINHMIYTAKLKSGKLNLTVANVGGPAQVFERTSVASCSSNQQNMLAIGSSNGIYRSTDGGSTWLPVANLPNAGLSSGDSNQAVAISPDCSTVAAGWVAGTFVSYDQGSTWTLLTDTGEYNNLHVDVTALVFDPVLAATLFMGSAGGVAEAFSITSGGTPTYESDWNNNLLNLEFFQGSASTSVTGLIGAATQDNGDIYAVVQSVWQHAIDCPGQLECWGDIAQFATPAGIGAGNDMLVAYNQLNPSAQGIPSANGNIPFNGGLPIPISTCPSCTGYSVTVMSPVRSPGRVLNASGEKMIAVAELFAEPIDDGIYGLFSSDSGADLHWELLNGGPSLWGAVTTIATTFDGGSIFVGDGNGRIFRLDSGTSTPPFSSAPVTLTVNTSCTNCGVTGLYALSFIQNDPNPVQTPPGLVFAAYSQHFMAYFGISFDEFGAADLPHDRMFLSVVATDTTRLYLASSAGVFESTNAGSNWLNASVGLPTFIAGQPGFRFALPRYLASHDYLQIVADPPPISDTRLYLMSYGRSLWRTSRPLPQQPAQRTFSNVTIEIQTGNDNAETYSEIQAVLHTSPPQMICLKPSATTEPSPGGVCPNSPGATDQDGNQSWANGMSVAQTFNFGTSVVLDGATLEIDLFQHNTGLEGVDNWDIQEIQVSGQDANGALGVLAMTNGPVNGNNCITRLKAAPGVTSVTYSLSGEDPAGINITHSVPNFGPTPPGSCPQ